MILFLLACTAENAPKRVNIRRFHTELGDLEEAVRIGFESGLPSMFQVGENYVEIFSQWGDEDCPRFTDQYSSVDGHWVDDCVTESGNRFMGFATFSQLSTQQGDSYGNSGIFSSVWGSFDAIHSDGTVRTIGGLGQIALGDHYGGFDMNLRGSFWLDNEHLWMREGSSSFELHGSIYDRIEFTGGVHYPEATIVFDKTTYDIDRCGGTAYGKMKLRDASGYWFDWQKNPCEDCAIVGWEGYSVGEICIGDALDDAIGVLIDDSREWIEQE